MNVLCVCGKEFKVANWQLKSGRGKFCSKRCHYDNPPPQSGFQKGHPVYQNTEATRFVKGQIAHNKGQPSPLRKENPGYWALHEWTERWMGKPKRCEHCKTTTAKRFDWSNKSGNYLREYSDWQRLCSKCHGKYDSGERRGMATLKFGGGWNKR